MKILLYTDLTIRPDQLFWQRDLGLLTKAFRDLGHDAYLAVHPATEPSATPAVPTEFDQSREQPCVVPQVRDVAGPLPTFAPSHIPTSAASNIRAQARPANAGINPPVAGAVHSSDCYSESSEVGPHSEIRNSKSPISPVLWASPSQVRDKEWWKDHHPDLVILGLWTRPKYDPIRRAALSATSHVIERADSDGMRTASCGLHTYAKRRFDYFRDRTYCWPSLLSIPASIFYSFASVLATPWIEYRLRKTLQLLPAVAVETPHATALWKSLATRLGINPQKIHCIPHPIQTDIFKFDPTVPKKNQIISVGRWESYQKNLPLLLKTLRAFLDQYPDWSSLVIGSGLPAKFPHPQITFLPPLSPPDLTRCMQESKIFLSSSRYESFGLAAAEAGACGCITVGTFENHNLRAYKPHPNGFFVAASKLLTENIESASQLDLIETTYMAKIASPSPQDIAKLILSILQNVQ